jgi:hypothetical protein
MESHSQHKLYSRLPLVHSFLLWTRPLKTDTSQGDNPSILVTSDSPNTDRWGKNLWGALLLLSVIVMFGCTTVVTPLQPGELTSVPKSDHGLVLGRIHLMWNGVE